MALDSQVRLVLRRKFYPDAEDLSVGPVARALERYIRPGSTVLDAGSGTGTWILKRYIQRAGLVIGADAVLPRHRQKTDAVVPLTADLAALPFRDSLFDVILCYNVIEHLPHPLQVLAEFRRLLVPCGALIVKTPALHAPAIRFSRLAPLGLHRWFKISLGGESGDVFPTYYGCNTMSRLDRGLRAAGLEREVLLTVDQSYDYLHFSRFTYILGLLYSRAAMWPGLGRLRTSIIAVYRRSPDRCLCASLMRAGVKGSRNRRTPVAS
jgi:SAM-dependent methyltransferase